MKSVREILDAKGHDVWSINTESTVYDALELMDKAGIGALVVIEKGKVVGIISERDYARKVVLKGKSSKDTPVNEVMTSKVVYVRPDETNEDCMALMSDKHVRHLPVIENENLIGVISIGDVVKATIADKEFIIEQLTNYITGGW
jgi:CBS domain-containing protein